MTEPARETLHDRNIERVEKLVVANRILYTQGVVDGFGHVSVRHGEEPSHFLISRSKAPALVTRDDILCCDFDGNVVPGTEEKLYLERFIHAEIYRRRPDVMAVVHSHSPNILPFGITRSPLRPVFHMAGFLGSGSAHFDIRDAAGNTDMLITNGDLGRSLADALAGHSCVLMRGHGSTVVGASLEQAVYRAVYAEVNAKLQTTAQAMGEITFLNEEEADLASRTGDAQVLRCWALWEREALMARAN